ncbi:unnamed protein product [Dracunculus medinensis]|uniref:GRIP domain-containing protein n=1 Tax=Dracunculus medinensis TaxID=318479 RepID=A0A0N4UE26_DRAME|nr:unnamed protein product [Dracunculus medinensis]
MQFLSQIRRLEGQLEAVCASQNSVEKSHNYANNRLFDGSSAKRRDDYQQLCGEALKYKNLKQLFGNERALLKAREEQLKMQLAEMTEKYESLFKIIRENQFENDSVSSKNGVDQIRNWKNGMENGMQPKTLFEARRIISQLEDDLRQANETITDLELKLVDVKENCGNDLINQNDFLQRKIDELEECKRNFQRQFSDQELTLHQLQKDLEKLLGEKDMFRMRCDELEKVNENAIKQNFDQSEAIKALRLKLSHANEVQNESARKYISQIETYQKLLKEKEAERTAFIQQLCYDDQMYSSAAFMDDLKETDKKMDELKYINERLQKKESELQQEKAKCSAMSEALVEANNALMDVKNEFIETKNRAKMLEARIIKLESELENANGKFKIEQLSTKILESANEELMDLLGKKTCASKSKKSEMNPLANEFLDLRMDLSPMDVNIALAPTAVNTANQITS